MNKEDLKLKIIELFKTNVKGKGIICKTKHCGEEGHWLETQMGIHHNNKNEPDIFGYEMKKLSKKITFGDFSASEYLFSKKHKLLDNKNKKIIIITKNQFCQYFGMPNALKNNRYSWSGSCVPKYNKFNECGQVMIFNRNNDLCIYYSYKKDKRETKKDLPEFLKENIVLIAIWTYDNLKNKINNKFNNNGFFLCQKVDTTFEKICFGKPFDVEYFINHIKLKNIIFDSGMKENNNRNYSHFRSSSKNFWEVLIIEEY